MFFIRIIFLFLVLMSLNVNAQTLPQASEQNNKTQPYKFDEYGSVTNRKLHQKLSRFLMFSKESNAEGLIILYVPTYKKIDLRLRMINRNWERSWCHWNCNISFTSRLSSKRERTEFWIIPKGAKPPSFDNQEK